MLALSPAVCREEEFRVESGSSELLPKRPAPPTQAASLNPYHKFCREQRLLLPTTLCDAEREKLLGKQWRALPEAERLEYKYKRATPMSEVLGTALEIMTEEEATEVLGGGPSAEDRSPPPLLPPLCVVRWRRQQQHGGPQADRANEQGTDKTVAQQQGEPPTADSTMLAASLAGGDSLLSDGINGIRPLLDSRHLLNAARADAKMSGHITSLLQSRASGGSLDDSLGGHEELQSFVPPLLFGSRPFPQSHSMGSLYGRPLSPSSRDGEDVEDEDTWMTGGGCGDSGKPRPGGADEKAGKTRFVWSAELHAHFEQAVAKLGVDRAKPRVISQLMGVEGDNAPTRQNIKSHLQKYRLLVKKRAAQAANDSGSGSGGGSPTMKMRPATKCAA